MFLDKGLDGGAIDYVAVETSGGENPEKLVDVVGAECRRYRQLADANSAGGLCRIVSAQQPEVVPGLAVSASRKQLYTTL